MSLLDDVGRFVRKYAPRPDQWPFINGDYRVIDASAPVVVAGVIEASLQKELAAQLPKGLCMIARLHGAADVANLVRPLASNLAVHYVVCAGDDGSQPPLGSALLLLGRGVDPPPGPVGTLMNSIVARVEPADLKTLRRRVQFLDLLGCRDVRKVAALVENPTAVSTRPSAAAPVKSAEHSVERFTVPRDMHYETRRDKGGDFGIRIEEHSIVVEHRNGKDRLLRVLEGKTARDICLALIRNGWVSRLDHAAYLGRELARAELALRNGQPFTPNSLEPVATLQPPAPDA